MPDGVEGGPEEEKRGKTLLMVQRIREVAVETGAVVTDIGEITTSGKGRVKGTVEEALGEGATRWGRSRSTIFSRALIVCSKDS